MTLDIAAIKARADKAARKWASSDFYQDSAEDVPVLLAALEAVQAILESDRTRIIDGVNGLSDALRRRQWLLTSRGSYEWDDARFTQEFRDAIDEIDKAVEPLRSIGADKSNCPQTTAEVIQARVDLIAALEASETARVKAEQERNGYRTKLMQLADATEVSGLSWSGFNIIGDKKSIKAVQSAVHYAGQIEEYRTAFADRLKQMEKERDTLKEALKPFADAIRKADEAAASNGYGLSFDEYETTWYFKHGQLRAARRALEAKP